LGLIFLFPSKGRIITRLKSVKEGVEGPYWKEGINLAKEGLIKGPVMGWN